VQGVERRLIESFMQRGVGDSPTPDISEQDIENVARVIREKKPADVREAARHLRVLAARGAATGADAAEVFASIEASDEIKAQLARWAKALRALKSGSAVNAQIETYYQAFVEQHLPEEHAARIALPNALKSAELRYHHDLLGFSKILAVVEGLAIAWWVASGSFGARAFVGVAAAAGLFVLSQGSKGLLDAIVGLGSRLRTQS
jgi:hypothetical protein